MIELTKFKNLRLYGGFLLREVKLTDQPLLDGLGREAVALTRISGCEFSISLRSAMNDDEVSISLYHEVLEAAAVACPNPPEGLMEFNEADFEEAAQDAWRRWGLASVESLSRILQFHGFGEE